MKEGYSSHPVCLSAAFHALILEMTDNYVELGKKVFRTTISFYFGTV